MCCIVDTSGHSFIAHSGRKWRFRDAPNQVNILYHFHTRTHTTPASNIISYKLILTRVSVKLSCPYILVYVTYGGSHVPEVLARTCRRNSYGDWHVSESISSVGIRFTCFGTLYLVNAINGGIADLSNR